jgi:hypothetical protein
VETALAAALRARARARRCSASSLFDDDDDDDDATQQVVDAKTTTMMMMMMMKKMIVLIFVQISSQSLPPLLHAADDLRTINRGVAEVCGNSLIGCVDLL